MRKLGHNVILIKNLWLFSMRCALGIVRYKARGKLNEAATRKSSFPIESRTPFANAVTHRSWFDHTIDIEPISEGVLSSLSRRAASGTFANLSLGVGKELRNLQSSVRVRAKAPSGSTHNAT